MLTGEKISPDVMFANICLLVCYLFPLFWIHGMQQIEIKKTQETKKLLIDPSAI